jgi:HEAT repeat protein
MSPILLLFLPAVVLAYIDGKAENLTLPRLLLEFRNSGIYRVERVDAQRGAVLFRLVEAVQGCPPQTQKHALGADRLGKELPAISEGDSAFLMGPDPYKRCLALVNSAWYMANHNCRTGWSTFAYSSSHYDFGCGFSGSLPQLVACCKALLDGHDVVVPCRRKPKDPALHHVRCFLRDPHRKIEASPAETQPAPAAAPADPALRAMLDTLTGDPFARRRCAITLGRMGPAAAVAVPALLPIVRDGYGQVEDIVGWEAAVALTRIDPAGEMFIPILRRQLKNPAYEQRRRAVELAGILGAAGAPPATVTPLLVEGLRDTNQDVRQTAACSMNKFEIHAASAVRPLVAALGDKHRAVAESATEVLRSLGQDAVGEIGKALGVTTDAPTRRRAARLLYELGPAAAPARDALTAAQTDADAEVRNMATEAVKNLGKK